MSQNAHPTPTSGTARPDSSPDYTPASIGWEWDESRTVGENAVAAVEALPTEATRAEIDDFLLRYVRGAGPSIAAGVLERADRTTHPAADFM